MELSKEQQKQREHIQSLKQKRIEFNKQIQAEFDKLQTMQDKFIFLYDLLQENQLEFAKWNKTDFVFSPEYKQNLIEKSKTFTRKKDFIDTFINDIIKPLNQGHCYMFERSATEDFLSKHTAQDLEDDNNFKYKFIDNNTLYVRVKSFFKAYFEYDKKKIEILKDELKDKDIKNFILDIRGNSGGTDVYLDLILYTLQANMTHTIKWYNTALKENEEYTATTDYGNKQYNYYVLTDNKVFSAAEVTTKTFRQNGAIIVGTKTRGEAGISPELQIKVFSYKNSEDKEVNLICQIPISAPVNEKGKVDYNCTYTSPDIECDPDEALNVALNTIQERENQAIQQK